MFSMNFMKFSNLSARRFIIAALCLMLLSMVSLGMPSNAGADSVVTTIDDDENDGCLVGDCSLREAIIAANVAGGTITFAPGLGGTITLTSSLPDITANVTITGPSSSGIVLNGDGLYRILYVSSGTTASIKNLTLTNGYAFLAGAGRLGGAIFNEGDLLVENCTFSNNWADGPGGAIFNNKDAELIVQNSTFSGNFSVVDYWGGCINNDGIVEVLNSTFSGNLGICLFNYAGDEGQGVMTVINSILGANADDSSLCKTVTGQMIDGGYNIAATDNGGFCSCGADLNLTCGPTLLGPLASNGGPTQTMMPLPGSPAIDVAGVCDTAPATDQRGIARPYNGNCEIGAVEVKTPASNATLTANFPSPYSYEQVVFTAGASGGSGNYEYQFLARNNCARGNPFVLVQNFSAVNTLRALPLGEGNFTIQVWVRNVGSTNNETGAVLDYSLVKKFKRQVRYR